jgi:hypothetical protein
MNSKRILNLLSVFALLCLLAPLAAQEVESEGADTVVLKTDGQVVIGTIIDRNDREVKIRISDPAGTITFNYNEIDSINMISAERILTLKKINRDLVERVKRHRRLNVGKAGDPEILTPVEFAEQAKASTRDALESSAKNRWNTVLNVLGLAGSKNIARHAEDVGAETLGANYDWTTDTYNLIVEIKKYGKALKKVDDGLLAQFGSSIDEYVLARELQRAATVRTYRNSFVDLDGGMFDDRTLAISGLLNGSSTVGAADLILSEVGLNLGTFMSVDRFIDLVPEPRMDAIGTEGYLAVTDRTLTAAAARFCQLYYNAGGWTTLNRILADPPRSTEMLLHPEKYGVLSELDFPTNVTISDPTQILGPGYVVVGDFTMGELTMRQFLAEGNAVADANEAAAGWGGDHCLVYSSGPTEMVIMVTVWDTANDAAQFKAAVKNKLDKLSGRQGTVDEGKGLMTWERNRSSDFVSVSENNMVVVALGVPQVHVSRLAEHLAASETAKSAGAGIELALSPETWSGFVAQLDTNQKFWSEPNETPALDSLDAVAGALGATGIALDDNWQVSRSSKLGDAFPVRLFNPTESREVFFGIIQAPFETTPRSATALAVHAADLGWSDVRLDSLRVSIENGQPTGIARIQGQVLESDPIGFGGLYAVQVEGGIAVFAFLTSSAEAGRGLETLESVYNRILWD